MAGKNKNSKHKPKNGARNKSLTKIKKAAKKTKSTSKKNLKRKQKKNRCC